MQTVINIFSLKINSVSNNGSAWVGANMAFGDLSPNGSISANGVGDPDISDQDQIANPSGSVVNQF